MNALYETDCLAVEVKTCGSLDTIIKQAVIDDNLSQKGKFDVVEQQKRIVEDLTSKLSEHPEIVSYAIRKSVTEKQRQNASSGLDELRSALLSGDQQTQIQSVLEAIASGKTLCVKSGIHCPIGKLTSEDLYFVWERQKDESEVFVHNTGETKKAFSIAIERMKALGAKILEEAF